MSLLLSMIIRLRILSLHSYCYIPSTQRLCQLSTYCLSAPNSPFIVCSIILMGPANGPLLLGIMLSFGRSRCWRDGKEISPLGMVCFSCKDLTAHGFFTVQPFQHTQLLQHSETKAQSTSPVHGSSSVLWLIGPSDISFPQHSIGWFCSNTPPYEQRASLGSLQVALWQLLQYGFLPRDSFLWHLKGRFSASSTGLVPQLTPLLPNKPQLCAFPQGLDLSPGGPLP